MAGSYYGDITYDRFVIATATWSKPVVSHISLGNLIIADVRDTIALIDNHLINIVVNLSDSVNATQSESIYLWWMQGDEENVYVTDNTSFSIDTMFSDSVGTSESQVVNVTAYLQDTVTLSEHISYGGIELDAVSLVDTVVSTSTVNYDDTVSQEEFLTFHQYTLGSGMLGGSMLGSNGLGY